MNSREIFENRWTAKLKVWENFFPFKIRCLRFSIVLDLRPTIYLKSKGYFLSSKFNVHGYLSQKSLLLELLTMWVLALFLYLNWRFICIWVLIIWIICLQYSRLFWSSSHLHWIQKITMENNSKLYSLYKRFKSIQQGVAKEVFRAVTTCYHACLTITLKLDSPKLKKTNLAIIYYNVTTWISFSIFQLHCDRSIIQIWFGRSCDYHHFHQRCYIRNGRGLTL